MAEILLTLGWIADLAALLWVGIIFLDILLAWIPSLSSNPSWWVVMINRLALPPVNMVRITLPTVYRGLDLSPWLTIIFLILIRTFACRAVIYWGMLHRA